MNEELRDSRGAAPCKHCLKKSKGETKNYPIITCTDHMYYARCPECSEYDKYDFLALSEKKAINVWNATMEGKGFSVMSGKDN